MHSSALKAFRLEMYKTHQCKTRRCEQQPCFWFTCHCLQSLSCYQNMDGSGCRDCSSFSNKSPTGSESYPGKVEEAGVWDSWIQCYWGDTAGKRLGFGLAFFFFLPSNVWPQSFTLSDRQVTLPKWGCRTSQEKGKAGCFHMDCREQLPDLRREAKGLRPR